VRVPIFPITIACHIIATLNPWKALPFASRNEKAQLAGMYGVQGIPMLVFLNENGEVITTDGRSVITNSRGNVDTIWSALSK